MDLLLLLGSLDPRRHTATICGHHTKRIGRISAFGGTTYTALPKNEYGSMNYCLACIGKMAIRCPWCEGPIFIGDPITLYLHGRSSGFYSSKEPTPAQQRRWDKNSMIPDNVARHGDAFVGCLRWDCADTGADHAGFWVPDENGQGRVERTPTAFEQMLGLGVDTGRRPPES